MDFQAFLITFREALEAVLIVGLILSYLTRLGAAKYKKWVFVGVFLGLVSSFLIALLFQVIFTGFASLGSEIYLKVTIMFISVLLLSHMVLWMTKQSKGVNDKMEKKIQTALSAGSISAMIIHSYLIIVREGVETVFFFAAISNGDVTKVFTSFGALSGLLLAIIVGNLFFSGTLKVSLKAFFSITGVLIMFIAAGLLVQGIGILQDIDKMGSIVETADGKPAEMYNIVEIMPEHYLDELQYNRDTGNDVIISGQFGLFMAAMFGYNHNPSFEQVAAWWLYFGFIFAYVKLFGKGRAIFRFWKTRAEKEAVPQQQKQVNSVNAG